jgi:hypothetical protein
MNILLLVPLACGLAFPLAAWLLKRAMEEAGDAWGPLFAANLAMAAAFVPPFLVFDGDFSREAGGLWQPLLCGLLFFIGQVAACKSFHGGDLSLAVPAQGTKALLVAVIAALWLGDSAGWNIWLAAALTPLALFFLRDHLPGKAQARRHRRTLLLASLAALAFAALDVGIQAWSRAWGVWRFGFWAFSFQAVLSLGLLALPGRRFRFGGGVAMRLAAGAFGLAAISLGLTWVISASGAAAWTNLLFNSRVLWSVVWVALGGWLAGSEGTGKRERRLVRCRFAGAALMMLTIALAVW